MPDFAVHSIFGEELLPSPQVQNILPGPRELAPWQWGLQGPDPLFFRGVTSPVGSRMHQAPPEKLFQAMLRHLGSLCGPPRDTAAAWLWGFLAHYVLDRTVHPYVLAKQKEMARLIPGATGNALHYQVETDMDTDLYLLVHRQPVTRMDPAQGMSLEPWQKEVIAGMLSAGAWEAFGLVLPLQEGVRSLESMAFVQKLIFHGGRPLRAVARGAEVVLSRRGQLTGHMKGRSPRWDSLNLGRNPWTDPRDGARRTETVPELLEAARQDLLPLMDTLRERAASGDLQPLPLGGMDFSGFRRP
jgi:hypothetical protein